MKPSFCCLSASSPTVYSVYVTQFSYVSCHLFSRQHDAPGPMPILGEVFLQDISIKQEVFCLAA